ARRQAPIEGRLPVAMASPEVVEPAEGTLDVNPVATGERSEEEPSQPTPDPGGREQARGLGRWFRRQKPAPVSPAAPTDPEGFQALLGVYEAQLDAVERAGQEAGASEHATAVASSPEIAVHDPAQTAVPPDVTADLEPTLAIADSEIVEGPAADALAAEAPEA